MKVYKYMPTYIFNKENQKVDIIKYIFEDNTLWFSNPLRFNDPFELKPHIYKLVNEEKHLVVDAVSSFLNASNQAHNFHYATINPILNNVGILSLSKNKEHLAMWAHYADNHKGIVLEFEADHWFFKDLKLPNDDEVLHHLEKVTYIPKDNRKSIPSDKYFTKETFLSKSKDWEYEEEYRMSVYVALDNEYIDGISMKFPNDLMTGVYLGNKASCETKDYILNLLDIETWKHLKVFQMEIDEVAYKLLPRELNSNATPPSEGLL